MINGQIYSFSFTKKKKKLKITRDWFSKLDDIIYRLVTTAI